MARLTTTADTFADFDRFLGSKDSRKVSHNTYAERQADGSIGIRLHSTVILTFHSDETMTLNSGGWRTVTTKDRLNSILPAPLGVSSDHGVWTVSRRGDNPSTVSEFYDGMRMNRHGEMATEVLVDSGAELRKIKREISRYVKRYDDATVTTLIDRAASEGTTGDCLFCQMGDRSGDRGHLVSHMEEGYVMASLMVNALKHVGYRDHQLPTVIRMGTIVRRAMRRYLVETLTTSHGARPAGRDGQTEHFAVS
jgi:hypothetical protein